jgi:hypothetical protein
MTLTTTLSGGRLNPILVVDSRELAEDLVDLFRPDVLYPTAATEPIDRFVKAHDYLTWPGFLGYSLFHSKWQHIPAHGHFVDVYHPARRLRETRKRRERRGLRLSWAVDDPLHNVLLATFGSYPMPSDDVPDYDEIFRAFLGDRAIAIAQTDNVPVVKGWITPSLLTMSGLMTDGNGADNGVFVGHSDEFDDVVTFWNLRASGGGLLFIDPRHPSRFADRLAAHKSWLATAPSRAWQRDGSITVYGREAVIDGIDLSFVGAQAVRHHVGSAIWNGLNIRPSRPHWRERSVLGSVDEPGQDRPSLTLPLPAKPTFEDPLFSQQWLVASILGTDWWGREQEMTFFPPYVPDLNEYFGRELHFNYSQFRAEPPDIWQAVSVLVHASTPDVTLRALPVTQLIAKLFERFKIQARPSEAGLITSRLIAQMGGLQGCRVFKITGVRKLIGKYSPDQAFTRSGAIQAIRDVDPRTNVPSFTAFEDLHLATRDRANKLTAQHALDQLIERRVFRLGLDFECPICQLRFWRSLDDSKTRLECEYCGTTFDAGRQLRDRDWAFRRSGLFGRSDNQAGGIPVAVTLQQLEANLSTMERQLSSTSLLLSPLGDIDVNHCETDFVMILTGHSQNSPHLPQVAIGECKARFDITEDDAINLAKVADALPERRLNVFILFAKLGEFSGDEVRACALAQHRWKQRVILLSQRELEPFFLYERHDLKPRPTIAGLEDLAAITVHLYPALRPKGWLEREAADAARRAQRVAVAEPQQPPPAAPASGAGPGPG